MDKKKLSQNICSNSNPKVIFPITFKHKNICLHCGAEGTLKYIDIRKHTTNNENMFTIDKAICTRCNRLYKIIWEKDDTGEYKATVTDNSVNLGFNRFLTSS